MFMSNAYWRVPVPSLAPFPSLQMPAIVLLCARSSMKTTANMLIFAFAPLMSRSPTSACLICHYCLPSKCAAYPEKGPPSTRAIGPFTSLSGCSCRVPRDSRGWPASSPKVQNATRPGIFSTTVRSPLGSAARSTDAASVKDSREKTNRGRTSGTTASNQHPDTRRSRPAFAHRPLSNPSHAEI